MKQTIALTLLTASLLSAKTQQIGPNIEIMQNSDGSYTYIKTDAPAMAHHSHKKMWISIGIIAGTAVLAGTLGSRPRQTIAPDTHSNLKLITCGECTGKAQ